MILKFEKVRKSFTETNGETRVILDNLDLVIEEGDFITVTGPSGSGKSTILSLAGSLLRPDQGNVELMGVSTAALGDKDLSCLRNRWIGYVFQASLLIPSLTVMENILVPKIFTKDQTRGKEKEDKKRAEQLLEELGLSEHANMLPYQLSLGQRRRVALSRALINEPKLILADEPTGDLDPERAHQVADLLQGLWKRGVAVLMVTHEPWLASLAPKQYRLEEKRLVSTLKGGANSGA